VYEKHSGKGTSKIFVGKLIRNKSHNKYKIVSTRSTGMLEHVIELYISAVTEESLDILEDCSIKLFRLHFLAVKYFARKSNLHIFLSNLLFSVEN